MNQNILKGLLIILVIIDHNDFSRSIFPEFLRGFGFHVMGFMIVPFLRPAAALNRELLQYAFRLYFPFLVMVTVLSLAVAFLTPVSLPQQAGAWALALYSGNSAALKGATHMALLWFLPSFLSMVVLRTVIDGAAYWSRVAAIAALCLVHPFIGTVAVPVQHYLPLGLLPALYVLPLGYLGVLLHQKLFMRQHRTAALLASAVLFTLVKSCQMHFGFENEIGFAAVADYRNPFALLCNDAEAVTGVLMVFQASRFHLGSLVEACGRLSLQMYLFHAFVAAAIYKVLGMMFADADVLALFAVSLAGTVVVTLVLARLLTGHPLLRSLLFPRTVQELKAAGWRAAPARPAQAAPAIGSDPVRGGDA